MNKYCYITLVDSEPYLKAAYALAISLNKVQSQYPLFIMIPQGFFQEDYLIKHQELFNRYNAYFLLTPNFLLQNNLFTYNVTLNKFQCLTLQNFDNICFLDADNFVFKNIDSIFEKNISYINYTLESTPTCNVQEGTVRIVGNVFTLKPDYNLYNLIISLNIWYDFVEDEKLLTYLYNENILPYELLPDKYRDVIIHDGGFPKVFSDYKSFSEIEQICLRINQLGDFPEIKKINFTSDGSLDNSPYLENQKRYLENLIPNIQAKYQN